MRPARRGELALIAAACCFGTTFVVVQDAVDSAEPVPFLGVRFLVAAAVLWPFARTRRPGGGAGPGPGGELRAGVAGGLALLAGYVFQTVGLQYTAAATSAFVTYLLVVMVPVIVFVVDRRRPHRATLGGIAIALAGLALLTGPGGGFGRGEWLTLGCALAFAVHVVVVDRTVPGRDPVRLATVQLAVVGGVCTLAGPFTGGFALGWGAALAAVATGVFATALAFSLQLSGQRTVPPARAALLLLLEPVFAGLLDALAGDPLGGAQVVGAALILLAVVVGEVLPARGAGAQAAGAPS